MDPRARAASLERLTLRAALARRRAMWLTRLVDASVLWREPGAASARLLVIERGEIVLSMPPTQTGTPPIPPGYQPSVMARRELFTVGVLRSLRVLTTELKRLVAAGAPVALRFGVPRASRCAAGRRTVVAVTGVRCSSPIRTSILIGPPAQVTSRRR